MSEEEKKEEQKEEEEEEKNDEEKKEEEKEDSSDENTDDGDDDKEVEVPAKFKDLVEQIEEMSVLDLAELVEILEDKFGVSAAAPAAAVPVAGAAGGEGGGEEEKSEFDVELTEAGDSKINVIKAVRALMEVGLKEAKGMVDDAPSVLKEAVSKEEAEEMKGQLEEAGATVTLK